MRLIFDSAYKFHYPRYEPFYHNNDAEADVKIRITGTDRALDVPQNVIKYNSTCLLFDDKLNKHVQWDTFMLSENGTKCLSWLTADSDWSEAEIFSCDTPIPQYLVNNYLVTALCSRLSQFRGIFFHGSVIEHEGKGVVFTASSGVGKTTHALLWEKYFGDEIINGDRAIVRAFDEGIYVYGSPWSGSSDHIVNKRAPLAAVVVLEQAGENRIKKLSAIETIEYCATHCYLPFWSETLTKKCLDTLDEILEHTPVYLLKCRPDREAAVLVRDTVFPVE